MTALPSNLGLTNIGDGADIVAADHRNNYSSIMNAFNALLAILAAGNANQVLTSSGGATVAWASPTTYGTSFPGTPQDGQLHVLVDSTTNASYQWMFRYNNGSLSPYKWECVGGGPLIVSAASTTLPAHAGDYIVTGKGWVNTGGGSTTGANQSATLSVGGVTQDTQDTSNVPASSGSAFSYGGSSSFWGVGGLVAKVAGAVSGAAVVVSATSNPVITIMPVRLS